MNETKMKVIDIIASLMKNTNYESHFQSEEMKKIGLDSIKFIQMVVLIEEEFGIEFDDETLLVDYFDTISSLVKYIEDKIESISTN